MATASVVVLAAGWIWTGAFRATGMNHLYQASWWVQGWMFCCWLFSPVALLLALGGLIWEDEKRATWLAAALSVVSAGLIFGIFR